MLTHTSLALLTLLKSMAGKQETEFLGSNGWYWPSLDKCSTMRSLPWLCLNMLSILVSFILWKLSLNLIAEFLPIWHTPQAPLWHNAAKGSLPPPPPGGFFFFHPSWGYFFPQPHGILSEMCCKVVFMCFFPWIDSLGSLLPAGNMSSQLSWWFEYCVQVAPRTCVVSPLMGATYAWVA